jgi:HK97 family phage major capsid protein
MRPLPLVQRLGATFITGLRGNATLARQPGTATAYWLTNESTQITESNQTFGEIALSPKTVGAYTEVSRLLQEQTGGVAERVVRRDLASVTSAALDVAALAGSGSSGQPLGIVGTPSVGTFTGASIAWADALNAQTDVLTANAGGDGSSFGYVTTPAVAAVLAARQGFADTAPMWVGPLWQGTVAGARAYSTTSAPSATIVAGNWSELIVAEWGSGIELLVSERANFRAGIIGVACFYTVDVALADPAAFSVATSVS